MNWAQWAPWRRYKDAVEADGDLPEGVPVEERMRAQDKGIIMKETRQKDRGNFTSARKMLKSMGTPDGVGVH